MTATTTKSSDAIKRLETRIDDLTSSKISKDFALSEIDNLKESIKRLDDDLDNVPHDCLQTSSFKIMSKRIDDANASITNNDSSIKRLYIWQAGVGISLLLFFLTVGIAALVYVSDISHKADTNRTDLTKIEKRLDKDDEARTSKLENLVTNAILNAQADTCSQ